MIYGDERPRLTSYLENDDQTYRRSETLSCRGDSDQLGWRQTTTVSPDPKAIRNEASSTINMFVRRGVVRDETPYQSPPLKVPPTAMPAEGTGLTIQSTFSIMTGVSCQGATELVRHSIV